MFSFEILQSVFLLESLSHSRWCLIPVSLVYWYSHRRVLALVTRSKMVGTNEWGTRVGHTDERLHHACVQQSVFGDEYSGVDVEMCHKLRPSLHLNDLPVLDQAKTNLVLHISRFLARLLTPNLSNIGPNAFELSTSTVCTPKVRLFSPWSKRMESFAPDLRVWSCAFGLNIACSIVYIVRA